MTVVDTLRRWLDERDPSRERRYLVAYSGGMDSHVLLHGLAASRGGLSPPLTALHVDHALQEGSAGWERHCRRTCRELGIAYRHLRLGPVAGEGIEAAAREARYRWFAEVASRGDVVVTAHHADDQAETVLYNLFRGAGPRGLAGMRVERPFARGFLARPLLSLPREVLHRYAREHDLEWIEDPSNFDAGFDRNYIRHRLMPVVMARWPAAARTIGRASVNFAEIVEILDGLARAQVTAATVFEVFNPVSGAPVLDAASLARLPSAEFFNVVRYWIAAAGYRSPPRQRLEHLRQALVGDGAPASGTFTFDDAAIRRYRGVLYLTPSLPSKPLRPRRWRIDEPLELGLASLVLSARPTRGVGLSRRRLAGRVLEVDFATAGRRLRLAAAGPTKSLRKVFQEKGVPPFLRRVLPRVSLDGELLAVPGVAQNIGWRPGPGEAGVELVIERRELSATGDEIEPPGALW